ncbi:hypothetical protein FAES_5207 [Fibrella aestuarina BUZ 2]|uniref:Uncharacterized protein n=1 Tax=Fibrella aestuarina BUZ 2 TaxID=1166018 RepID=I0KGF3_9BACT|nr:hypothetical protein [Fibrella aestuarina]CCH03206.1 hypothetical protein FAES_5207 [Fibrella aestuarina BUZ 2]
MSTSVNLNDLSPEQLREAVARLGDSLKSPADWEAVRPQFTQVESISIRRLQEIITLTEAAGSSYVKLYNALDEAGNHFFFLAPSTTDGRALDGSDAVAVMCCCSRPPCPDSSSDRYYTVG